MKAVDNVSLRIGERQTVGLVGESGCGKSMTALSIMRLVPDPPAKIIGGKVLFKSKDLLRLNEEEMRNIRGSEVSLVFQDPLSSLDPVMKVGNQITEAIMLHQKTHKKEAWSKAVEILDAVKLPSPSEIAKQYPHQLSGGMRQRVMIAIALSCNPSLLIADEPTTLLDVTVQAQVLDLMKELISKFGISLMLITHDLGIAAGICEKLYVMYAGEIVEYADVFTLFGKPKHPYTKGLLESAESIDKFKEELRTIPGTVPDLVNPPPGCRFHPRCQRVKAVCRTCKPQLNEVSPGHGVSCFLYQ